MADIYKSKFTGQEIDEILTNAYNVTNIEANPSGEATEELTKLTIGDITYNLGGGTPVEANPSGEATEELNKLKINGVIYSISTNLITLTIGDYFYNAVKGMTWEQWVESKYNTGDFYNSTADGAVRKGNECINGDLSLQTKLVSNTKYSLVTYSHGGGSN